MNTANNMLPRLRASCARHPLLCVAAALLASMACLSVSCDDLAADTVRLFVAAALMGAIAFVAGWLRPVCFVAFAARFFVPLVSLVVAAAAAIAGFSSAVSLFADFGGLPSLSFRSGVLFALSCLATALFEEILFRGIVFNGFLGAFRLDARDSSRRGLSVSSELRFMRQKSTKRSIERFCAGVDSSGSAMRSSGAHERDFARACVLAAITFGILHVSVSSDVSAFGLVGAVQFAVKPVQATVFGCLMTCSFTQSRGLLVPVALHFAYDALAHLPVFLATGALPVSYVTGDAIDLLGMIASTLILTAPLAGFRAFRA